MKKVLSLIISLVLILAALPMGVSASASATSGTNGDCSWSVKGNVITISGKGATEEFYSFSSYDFCKTITKAVVENGVERIGASLFCYCSSLTDVVIPESVTSIGSGAFYGCESIQNVYITDIGKWSSIKFEAADANPLSFAENLYLNNKLVTSIEIPQGVETIGDYAFFKYAYANSLTLPDDIKNIGKSAFYLVPISTLNIPDGVESIGVFAFSGCKSLKTINFFGSVKKVGKDAFKECGNVEYVNTSNIKKWCNIEFENNYANPVYYADKLYYNNELITDLRITEDIELIREYVFCDCRSIENVFISEDAFPTIETNAFWGCSNIENLCFEGSLEEWKVGISGNYNLECATLYYNCKVKPGEKTSIGVYKLPNKLQYIENEEKLDCSGGIYEVNYEGGATRYFNISSSKVTGFDNTVLGKQTLVLNYENFTTQFEIEIIPKPLVFIAVSNLPQKTEYTVGEALDLTGAKIVVGYNEGNYEMFDITADMVSGFDSTKAGIQILNVTYKGIYKTQFAVAVLNEVNPDIDGDGKLTASDVVLLRKNLINMSGDVLKYDINNDRKFDIRDLISIKKLLV